MASFSTTKGKTKTYGLIIPSGKKTVTKPVSKPSAFEDSSSDEENDGKKHVNISLKREHEKRKKQTQEAAAQALAEDPSIFEYDSLYDKMTEEKRITKLNKDTKPKYVHALKRAAERRKLEGELVYEHMAQKEIEQDQEKFRDKESFVTSAYKEKLAERKVLEEELAREAALEEVNDVTKQKDLSRFQKHLFNQVVSPSASMESEREQPSVKDGGPTHGEQRETEDRRRQSVDDGSRRGERRQSYETERRHERKERRSSSDRRSREGEERHRQSHDDHHSHEPHHERRSSHRDRRDSHGRQDRSPEQHQKSSPDHQTSSTAADVEKNGQEKDSTPPKKKMKLKAGIEVEAEEITPVERRKMAAIKKATEETTKSAKERYLARKMAKAETEARRPSTSDD